MRWLLIAICAIASAADWQSARGPLGSGLAPEGPSPPLRRLWRAQVGSAAGPVAIVHDRVLVGTLQRGLICLALEDGHELWRAETGRDPVLAAPLVAGDLVIVGDEGGQVRAWALADGGLRWSHALGGKVLGGAIRVGETVLVGSYDHALHALALADGRELWRLETGGPVHAGPAQLGTQVLIAGCDGQIRHVDPADGRQLSEVAAGANVGATPAVVGELALIGVLDGRWLALAGGAVRWQGGAESERFECAPAADSESGVLVSREGVVRALALADGKLRWSVQMGGGVEAAPMIAGAHAWIADAGGELHALALADGSETWRVNIGSPLSDPAAAHGRLLVGAADGSVWCFGSVR